jgi:hypothetical protein
LGFADQVRYAREDFFLSAGGKAAGPGYPHHCLLFVVNLAEGLMLSRILSKKPAESLVQVHGAWQNLQDA